MSEISLALGTSHANFSSHPATRSFVVNARPLRYRSRRRTEYREPAHPAHTGESQPDSARGLPGIRYAPAAAARRFPNTR